MALAVINRILPRVFEDHWPDHARAMRDAGSLPEAKAAANAAANAAWAAEADRPVFEEAVSILVEAIGVGRTTGPTGFTKPHRVKKLAELAS